MCDRALSISSRYMYAFAGICMLEHEYAMQQFSSFTRATAYEKHTRPGYSLAQPCFHVAALAAHTFLYS